MNKVEYLILSSVVTFRKSFGSVVQDNKISWDAIAIAGSRLFENRDILAQIDDESQDSSKIIAWIILARILGRQH